MSSDIASVRPKIRSKHSEKLMGEPLERRSIRFEDRDGIERYYPALHIRFSHTMVFTKYSRPPIQMMANLHMNGQDLQSNDEIQKWIANVVNFEEMLKTLLRLEHNRFWSTLIYERSLQISLESYLRSSPRDHDLHNCLITDQMKMCVKRVHILVFKLFVRICSITESKTSFISENTFGSLIYDNYLIDVSKIIDLSVLYANTCFRQLLMRMLSNVIRCQPRYDEDLAKGCLNISEALNSIQQRLGIDENQFETSNKLAYFQWSELQSIVSLITDISVSLQSLLLSLPQMANVYIKTSLHKTIVEFYNRVFPSLQNELNLRFASIENDLIVERNKRQLRISRSLLIQTFREIIKTCFLEQLMNENLIPESKVNLIDGLIDTLTFATFDKSFITDYCIQYPIEKDFTELSKYSELTQFENFDKTRIDYLKSIIKSSISFEAKSKSLNTSNENDCKDYSKTEDKVNGFVNIEEINGIDIQLESNIQYICDIMPELGKGFVEKCLQFYDFNNEKVLEAILENNLPPHLDELDRSLELITHKKQINKEKAIPIKSENNENNDSKRQTIPEVIDERLNVYNNDEFDIFRNKDIDLSRIHLGKKDKVEPKLDDTTKEKIMSIHYKTLEEEERNEFSYYDDEYDDTYEDDSQIDLPNDKLLDELDSNTVESNESNKGNTYNNKKVHQKTYYNNSRQKSRNYR